MPRIFKKATLTPKSIVAGDSAEFVVTLAIGKGYPRGPSRIVFDFPATLGMSRPSVHHHRTTGTYA
ncbi:MAG: hypothetical protein JXR37_31030 [Kiritimatiellae bacterium]|nr:hypothetical protein [Kiritimatiellia bacterium]